MTKASDNPYPSILIEESAEPSAPAAGHQRLYVDSSTHTLHRVDENGDEVDLEAAGSGIAASLFDAKGDLIAASAADTAARLPVGANGSALIAASGETTGLVWRLNNDGASAAPTVNDDSGDGYSVGSRWLDTTADKEYVCTDASSGAAVWVETTGGSVGGSGTASAVKVYATATQALANGTPELVDFDSEELDTDGYFDSGTSVTNLVIPTGKGGIFLPIGYVFSSVNTTFVARWKKNGAIVRSQATSAGGFGKGMLVSCGPVSLADADVMTLEAILFANGNIGDASNAEQQCWASLTRIGD